MPDAILTEGWETIFDNSAVTWYAPGPVLYVSPVIDVSAYWRVAVYGYTSIADATYVNVGLVPIQPDGTNVATPTAAYVNLGQGGQFSSTRNLLLTTFSREMSSGPSTVVSGMFNQMPYVPKFTINVWSSNAGGSVTGRLRVLAVRNNPLARK